MISLRDEYQKILAQLGAEDRRLVVLDADLGKSSGTSSFRARFPDRYFNIGIAEQNMVGIAAGLAIYGWLPFAHSFGSFLSQRACDQIIVSVALSGAPVTLVAFHAGLGLAEDGATQQSVFDLAIVRSIPGLSVVCPADDHELRAILRRQIVQPTPLWVRLGRTKVSRVFRDDAHDFRPIVALRSGAVVCLVATGSTTSVCMDAAVKVHQQTGVSPGVVHVGQLKPFDRATGLTLLRSYRTVVTVEEHSIIGGLHSAVCELLVNESLRVVGIGVNDQFGESACPNELLKKHGLDLDSIVHTAVNEVQRATSHRPAPKS